jgi:hypothetical protein
MKIERRQTFDYNAVMTCMMVWEWIDQNDTLVEEVRDDIGSYGMRDCAIRAGEIVDAVYALMESKQLYHDHSFDWEFVPAICEHLDWPALAQETQWQGERYEPDLEALLANVKDVGDLWIDTAKAAAKKQWAYPELVDDHADSIDRAEPPADWVKRIGEKYDLTPAEAFR